VTHHRDIFVSHVLPKLNETDRMFFSGANSEGKNLFKYAEINVLDKGWCVSECLSISTLEWAWNHIDWGGKFVDGVVIDQARFCAEVACTNKLEFPKWVREVKKCEWNEWTITMAAYVGNLEMLKYCFAHDCPCDKKWAFIEAAGEGYIDCLRFLFDKVKPSRETEKDAAEAAAQDGQLDILIYLFEERKISDVAKTACARHSAMRGHLDCLKYLVEEANTPLYDWQYIAHARYKEQTECLHYLREKGCPEPTDEEYVSCVEEFLSH
jgi:hypothetical protein